MRKSTTKERLEVLEEWRVKAHKNELSQDMINAVFNMAAYAIEQGIELTWSEAVANKKKEMQVELPSSEEFILRPCIIAGDECVLITPQHIGTTWTKQNLIFRSSIWTFDGKPVSLGFKKFVNWEEKPDLYPIPNKIHNCELIEKIDGSCLIVSKYKGELITRTRGTTDARSLANGHEILFLKDKYPKAFNHPWLDEGVTFLFEWTSAINQIVIKYGEMPNMYMTGLIYHQDYSLMKQKVLDEFAAELEVPRPAHFNFGSIAEMLEGIEKLQGQEGLCCYYNDDQYIRKCKSSWYLGLHSLKSNLTTDKLVEMWFIWGQPDYGQYCETFEKTFDFECLKFAQSAICKMFDGIKEYENIIAHLKEKVNQRRNWLRKEFAIQAQQEYGDTKKFGILMNLYLGIEPKRESLKHILLQNTKQVEMGMFKKEKVKEEER